MPTKRRQIRRRGSETTTNRALDEHFWHLTTFPKTTLKVDNMTLRECICHYKKQMSKGEPLGHNCWEVLAQLYVCSSDPVNQRKRPGASLPIADQFLASLGQLHQKNPAARAADPLFTYLRRTGSINEVGLTGLLRSMTWCSLG